MRRGHLKLPLVLLTGVLCLILLGPLTSSHHFFSSKRSVVALPEKSHRSAGAVSALEPHHHSRHDDNTAFITQEDNQNDAIFEAGAPSSPPREDLTHAFAVAQRSAAELPQLSAFGVLEKWGLEPTWHAEATSSHAPRRPTPRHGVHAWHRSRLLLLDSLAAAREQRVLKAEGHPTRPDDELAARAQWAHKCMDLDSEAHVAGRATESLAPRLSPDRIDARRESVTKHCFSLHYSIQDWLKEQAVKYGLKLANGEPGYPPASWGFYSGPWIEDSWISSFGRPLVSRMTMTDYFKGLGRHGLRPINMTSGKPISIADLQEMRNAGLTAVEYPPSDESTDGASGTGRPSGPPRDAQGQIIQEVDAEAPFDIELFMPWCPLFFPWENVMAHAMTTAKDWTPIESLAALLSTHMRPDIQYITVVQRAAGPWLLKNVNLNAGVAFSYALRNTLVISSGGTGHVPIPLLAGELPFLNNPQGHRQGKEGLQGPNSHALVFVGAERPGSRGFIQAAVLGSEVYRQGRVLQSSPGQLKDMLLDPATAPQMVQAWGEVDSTQVDMALGRVTDVDAATQAAADAAVARAAVSIANSSFTWLRAMAGGAYALAPRGTGPTSFRLYESLQLGIPPVYVHSGRPWLPYLKRGQSERYLPGRPAEEQSLWARIGHVVSMHDLDDWLAGLELSSADAWDGSETAGHGRSMADVNTATDVSGQANGPQDDGRRSDISRRLLALLQSTVGHTLDSASRSDTGGSIGSNARDEDGGCGDGNACGLQHGSRRLDGKIEAGKDTVPRIDQQDTKLRSVPLEPARLRGRSLRLDGGRGGTGPGARPQAHDPGLPRADKGLSEGQLSRAGAQGSSGYDGDGANGSNTQGDSGAPAAGATAADPPTETTEQSKASLASTTTRTRTQGADNDQDNKDCRCSEQGPENSGGRACHPKACSHLDSTCGDVATTGNAGTPHAAADGPRPQGSQDAFGAKIQDDTRNDNVVVGVEGDENAGGSRVLAPSRPAGRRLASGQQNNGERHVEPVPVSGPQYEAMRAVIAAVRDSHFTYHGVMSHIAELLSDPAGAELDCQPTAGLDM